MRWPQPIHSPGLRAIRSLCMFAVLAACLALAHQPADARPFKDMIGLQLRLGDETTQQIDQLLPLSVTWVRDTVPWPVMEPVAGTYRDFPPAFKARLDFFKRHAMKVLFVVGPANDQAYPSSLEKPLNAVDAHAVGKYAAQVSKMLRAAGVEFAIEVWNQPHGKGFGLYDVLGGQWNGAAPSPWVDQYVKIVRETVASVKQFDPSVRVITDDDMWLLHYWFLEGGLPKDLAGFGIHPYTTGVPELVAVNGNEEWARPFTVVDKDRSFSSAVRRLTDEGKQKLGHKPEIWITEWGWAPVAKGPDGNAITETTVAAYVPRAFVLAAASNVEVLCWYSAADADGAMGLMTNSGRKRPAFTAFATMISELGTTQYSHQILGLNKKTQGLQAFVFSDKFFNKVVLWNVEDRDQRVHIDSAMRFETAVDALGRRVPYEVRNDGVDINVSNIPIYLTVHGTPTASAPALSVPAGSQP